MAEVPRVEVFDPSRRAAWDRFIRESKNGTFLFQRGYMDYHADRFTDASLMFVDGTKLIAVLPANRDGDTLVSHGGLTYGGIVSGDDMRTSVMLAVFDALTSHARSVGLRSMIYKSVPHIYHTLPSEEDLYALFRHNAVLVRRDVSSTVFLADRPTYSKGRKHAVKRGKQQNLHVGRSYDFAGFMALEDRHLQARHGVRPVHTPAEMELLAQRFPENILLFTATRSDALLAGVLVYLSNHVAHAQYIASNEEGREACAPDAIMDYLLAEQFSRLRCFDFGISTEQQGRVLNEGLVQNKESYGGRAIAHDFYRVDLA